ncbi:alpha/beta-hydrolase [Myriangium duriaei CBS 260.36]|uniref:1-alkyl-2-acetylglycerophosphocholine esterase n=1 Tax=Myriangium duriaei CBS 260.36 TaxID=1168546 RepID=A0A9P4IWQ0_9PEZI|nr:alpha/beta-hydrolase [Myriangium duriaei CBS 260.36]
MHHLSAFAALLSVVGLSFTTATTLPHTPGPYGTSSAQLLLCDESRLDPYAAALNITEKRHVMVSSFYPTGPSNHCAAYNSTYWPAATARFYEQQYAPLGLPNGTISSLKLQFCHAQYHHNAKLHLPVVLFSPGLGGSRLLYSAMAQSLASQGYIVVTIDHPYDANIVEFPDGSTVLAANITTNEQIEAAVDTRVKDVLFVLDQLALTSNKKHLFGPGQWKNTSHDYLAFGHSLGGATAVQAASKDPRLIAAVNLDGRQYGSVATQGSKKPILLVNNPAHENDPTWVSMWNATRETKAWIEIQNVAHQGISDALVIIDALSDVLTPTVFGLAHGLFGTIAGARLQQITTTFVGHFFSYSLSHTGSPLPDIRNGSFTRFPDVRLIGRG